MAEEQKDNEQQVENNIILKTPTKTNAQQQTSVDEQRLGDVVLSQPCTALSSSRIIYSKAVVPFDSFEKNFIFDEIPNTDYIPRGDNITLATGLRAQVQVEKFDSFGQHQFVILGFIANSKMPKSTQVILVSMLDLSFHLSFLTDLRIHAEPRQEPEFVQSVFPDFQSWITEVLNKKDTLGDLMLPYTKKNGENRRLSNVQPRQLLTRASKGRARCKILAQSPQKKTRCGSKQEVIRARKIIVPPVVATKEKNSHQTAIKSLQKAVAALTKRVVQLESANLICSDVKTKKEKKQKEDAGKGNNLSDGSIQVTKQFVVDAMREFLAQNHAPPGLTAPALLLQQPPPLANYQLSYGSAFPLYPTPHQGMPFMPNMFPR